jgi:arabinofuranosyltransferase
MKRFLVIALLFACVVGATAGAWFLHGRPTIGVDDANIYFSYAENLASGAGITYAHNGERVEGCTSMLWLLLCAASFAAGCGEIGVGAIAVLLCTATLLLVHTAIRDAALRHDRRSWALHAVFAALIFSSPGYITWMTITLMDTCLWGFFVAGMAYATVAPPRSRRSLIFVTILFATVPLARPEALFIGPVFLVLLFFRMRTEGIADAGRRSAIPAAAFVFSTGLLILFRMWYFGYPLPNTYYAKVAPSILYNLHAGKSYLFDFMAGGATPAIVTGFLLVYCAASFGGAVERLLRIRRVPTTPFGMSATTAIACGALALVAVPVMTGGDHFRMFRAFQPAYPLLCLAPLLFVHERFASLLPDAATAPSWWRQRPVQGAMLFVVLGYWLASYPSHYSWIGLRHGFSLTDEFQLARDERANGRSLTTLFTAAGKLPRVGVVAAGGFARGYAGPIVDVMGLNNSYVAHYHGDRHGGKNHAAFEIEAFLHESPDVLLASPPVPPATSNRYSRLLKNLHEDPRFVRDWRFGTLRSSDGSRSITAYFHTRYLREIAHLKTVSFTETMSWSGRWIDVSVTNNAAPAAPAVASHR